MSALVDKVYTLGNLMTFDNNGLSIASFVDIKRTLINRYRELYGIDIDVSDASADGQWITEIALLINNTFQAFNELYADLNPAVAQGKALDLLASFSNIARKPASASICNVILTSDIAFNLPQNEIFIDKNGNEWLIDESRSEYLPAPVDGEYQIAAVDMANGKEIPLICSITGAISVFPSTIIGFATITSANANVTVTQPNAGIKGSIVESDAHLRARRNQSAANEAVTIIDGIQGALLANSNIIDALVINHTVAGPAGTGIDAHTVEVITNCRRYTPAFKSFIANTIYDRLTPGIPTSWDHNNYGLLKQWHESISADYPYEKAVLWVEAVPIQPVLKIVVHPLANCSEKDAADNIIEAIVTYANNLGLAVDLNASNILQEVMFADPTFQGRATYYCTPADITLNNQQTPFTYRPQDESDKLTTSAAVRKSYYEYEFDESVKSYLIDATTHSYGNKPNASDDSVTATIIVEFEQA